MALEYSTDGVVLGAIYSQPNWLVKEKAYHGSSSVSPSQDGRSSPTEGSVQMQDTLPIPNKDKPLHRRMTNSDLIALATQHRQQQHTTHRRRQNLLQMGMSNVSDSSDTDTSGHSYSRKGRTSLTEIYSSCAQCSLDHVNWLVFNKLTYKCSFAVAVSSSRFNSEGEKLE
nr:uncharacterized protein LOC129254496 [Lytechinus pictus]